jgi:hypothetical protein
MYKKMSSEKKAGDNIIPKMLLEEMDQYSHELQKTAEKKYAVIAYTNLREKFIFLRTLVGLEMFSETNKDVKLNPMHLENFICENEAKIHEKIRSTYGLIKELELSLEEANAKAKDASSKMKMPVTIVEEQVWTLFTNQLVQKEYLDPIANKLLSTAQSNAQMYADYLKEKAKKDREKNEKENGPYDPKADDILKP